VHNPTIPCRQRELPLLAADPRSELWQSITPTDFRENIRGGTPNQTTALRVAWNGAELRVLFDASDEHPWATITERDGRLWEEEVIELFLDPIGDGASYFEIEVNPLGTVLDLVLRRNRSGWRKDAAWNCEGLDVAVQRTSGGWSAELAIPLRSLTPETPHVGTEWRVNFLRIDRPKDRERELSAWSPTFVGTFHAPERFGTLLFSE